MKIDKFHFDDLVKAIGKEVRPSQKVAPQTYLNLKSDNGSPKALYSKLMDQSKLVYPEVDVTREARTELVKTQFIQALFTILIEEVAKQANPHTLAKDALLEICTRVWEATIKVETELSPNAATVCALQPNLDAWVNKLERELSEVKQLLSTMSTQLATLHASQLLAQPTSTTVTRPGRPTRPLGPCYNCGTSGHLAHQYQQLPAV